jgi:hypothetical protein
MVAIAAKGSLGDDDNAYLYHLHDIWWHPGTALMSSSQTQPSCDPPDTPLVECQSSDTTHDMWAWAPQMRQTLTCWKEQPWCTQCPWLLASSDSAFEYSPKSQATDEQFE